jgi:hypothetical protein
MNGPVAAGARPTTFGDDDVLSAAVRAGAAAIVFAFDHRLVVPGA